MLFSVLYQITANILTFVGFRGNVAPIIPSGSALASCSIRLIFFAVSSTSVCFKVFKSVSWWSFRVSTPFSLLCLILLTHFHKNASLHPNMLNYLNTTCVFGKQTKDNFINRKVQCRPTHSFIYSFSCPLFLWESRGVSRTLGGPEIPHDQQQFQIVLLAPHQDGTKQSRRCSHAT